MSRDNLQRPLLDDYYERYLVNQDLPTYVRAVVKRYQIGSLERLALSGERMTRRGSVLALGRLGDYSSNGVLGRALKDRDRGVRTLAENGIRRLWMRLGTPGQQRRLVATADRLSDKQYELVVKSASCLVKDAPWIAEAWYHRGMAYFHLGQYDSATSDCNQALEINPYHYSAASIMGQSYLQANNPVAALESFRRALRLNPNMEEVRAQVIHLQRSLKNE